MGEVDPIDVGASFDLETEVGRIRSRCVNIFIDEDGEAQVRLEYGDDSGRAKAIMGRLHETLSAEEIRDKMKSGDMSRRNSGHDAFEWRQDH